MIDHAYVYFKSSRILSDGNYVSNSNQIEFWKKANAFYFPGAGIIPRFGELVDYPISVKSLNPLSEILSIDLKDSFKNIHQERAVTILKNSQNKTLNILYSGGIDSSLVILLIIDAYKSNPDLRNVRINILTTAFAFHENPNLFKHLLKLDFINVKCGREYYNLFFNNDHVLVNGELNDFIFGGQQTALILLQKYGNKSINYKECYSQYLKEKWFSEKEIDLFFDYFSTFNDINLDINNQIEFHWWMGINYKWDAINFRLLSWSPPINANNKSEWVTNNYITFFNDKKLQRWSLNNFKSFTQQVLYGVDKAESKQIINDLFPDNDYFENKRKVGSLVYNIYMSFRNLISIDDSFNFQYDKISNV